MLNKKYKIIHFFFLSIITIVMSSCVPKATEKKAVCGTNESFSSITRKCFSIVAPNKASVAANITPASFVEDIRSIITLSYTDVDLDLAETCQVKAVTNVTVTQACSCDVSGVCTVGITGDADFNGAAQFTYAVKSGSLVSNTATASLTLTAVNDAPTFSVIANQTTLEDTAKAVSFTITDVDNTLSCTSSVSLLSNSDVVLIPNASIVITQTSSSGNTKTCLAKITPARNQYSVTPVDVVLEVTDTTLSANVNFSVTVTAFNDAPTISFITAPTVLEDVTATITFTLADVDSSISCATSLSATSYTAVLALSASVGFTDATPAAVVVSGYTTGSTANCRATIPPVADAYGTSTVSVTVSDRSASSTSPFFLLTVTAVNDAPTISFIANLVTNEDVVKTTSFIILDVDNSLTCTGSVSKTSSNTTVLPVANIVITQTSAAGNSRLCLATFTPVANQSSVTPVNIIFTVTDTLLTNTTLLSEGIFTLTVNSVPDDPTFNASITNIHTNEGGMVVAGPFKVDEDLVNTTNEDLESMSITSITSDNLTVLPSTIPDSAITIFYDLNDNGVEDTGELRTIASTLESIGTLDSNLHNVYLKLYPIAGVSGNANISVVFSDGTASASITSTFSLIVHPIAALHGGWTNISAKGIKTDKAGIPASSSDVKCTYNVAGTGLKACNGSSCTGTSSPNASIIPDAANVIFWDSSNKKCYRSTGSTIYTWIDFNTSCPLIRNTSCTGHNCISSTAPVPTAVDQYYYNTTTGCYISTGVTNNSDWIAYTPSKVTLTWNAFTVAGSGADTGVGISGWNVYRREKGFDYDFNSGFLKLVSSATMSITGSTTRTFTDSTAVSGKIYYYLVRPVDNSTRSLTISTPEVFSEVRIFAAKDNYAFVHRWMANQEVCNSMLMTTSTTKKVDPTHNYRCPYFGPGETVVSASEHYYDIGKDMLVDISEAGCPYSAAPTCTSNGCVGIDTPTNLSLSAVVDSVYYNRSTGGCYINTNGTTGWALYTGATVSSKMNTALNPPLSNITQPQAIAACAARSTTAATGSLTGVITASLPTKKEYIAYSSAEVGVSDSIINSMEEGSSLNIQSRCNSSLANGLSAAYTDSTIPSTSYMYSIPGTSTSTIKSMYTGSVPWVDSFSTETCSSRFGIQDVYGNVAEWVKDTMTCNSGFTCSADAGTDMGDYDFDTVGSSGKIYGFDFLTGPYDDTNASSSANVGDSFLTSWDYGTESYNAGKFSFPIGMPINVDIATASASVLAASSALAYLLDIGPTSGITSNQLHEDGMIANGTAVNAGVTHQGAFAQGGSYLSGDRSGRYSSELIPIANSYADVGFRCYIPIDTGSGGNYPTDPLRHTYSY